MNYKKVDYAIEATDNEAFRLWEANHSKMEWKQNSYGYMPTVKELKILNEQGKVKLVLCDPDLGYRRRTHRSVLRAHEQLRGLGGCS